MEWDAEMKDETVDEYIARWMKTTIFKQLKRFQ